LVKILLIIFVEFQSM